MAIRAVVFDLGHTLWDFAPTIESRRFVVLRLHTTLERALGGDVPPPAALDRVLHEASLRWFKRWDEERDDLSQPPSETFLRDALAELGVPASPALLRAATGAVFAGDPDMPVVAPDTLAALGELDARGLRLGCVTNTVSLEAGINDVIERLGLRRYLRSVVVSSAMRYRKPHPSLFRRALDDLDVAPREAVFVGDRLRDDVAGAKAIGMLAVLTHQYRQEPLDGARLAPDAVIRRLSDLPAAIARMEAED